MNVCNCSRSLLVNVVKNSFLRQRTPFVVLSSALKQHSFEQQIKNFSLSHNHQIFYTPSALSSVSKEQYEKASTENEERERDEKGRLIVYNGALSRRLVIIKVFSINTTLMGFGMQYIILRADNSLAITILTSIGVGIFTFVTPFLINLLAKRYITKILFDEDQDLYTAVLYNFFLMKRELTFSVDEIEAPDLPGPFTTILVHKDKKKLPLFFIPDDFTDQIHYGRLMRFDKPLDLHLMKESIDDMFKKPE